jgi:hypothetical protein
MNKNFNPLLQDRAEQTIEKLQQYFSMQQNLEGMTPYIAVAIELANEEAVKPYTRIDLWFYSCLYYIYRQNRLEASSCMVQINEVFEKYRIVLSNDDQQEIISNIDFLNDHF